jgi:hypothetical protein
VKLTTRTYDALHTKQSSAPSGVGMEATSALSGADAQTVGMLQDYMDGMKADDMRKARDKNIWADIAIRRRMDALRDQLWVITARNPRLPIDQALADEITDILLAPDPELEDNSFGTFWGALMDDCFTIGRGAAQLKLNKDLTVRGFRLLDAAKLRPNPEWKVGVGDAPSSTAETKRWIYEPKWNQKIYLASDEVMLVAPYLSTHDRTGLSPIKSLRFILQAELDTRRMMHGTQKFRTPPGVFVMPGAAPGSPEKARRMYDLKMAGRPTIGFMNLPKDSKFVEFGGINLIAQGTFQFYEILVRATAAGFGTTPFMLGWTDQDNRANSQTQLAISDRGRGGDAEVCAGVGEPNHARPL